jgi:hypothetical protein
MTCLTPSAWRSQVARISAATAAVPVGLYTAAEEGEGAGIVLADDFAPPAQAVLGTPAGWCHRHPPLQTAGAGAGGHVKGTAGHPQPPGTPWRDAHRTGRVLSRCLYTCTPAVIPRAHGLAARQGGRAGLLILGILRTGSSNPATLK